MNTIERVRVYLRNIWLWAHFHWLWSDRIRYLPGWTPARFLLPYCTTYLLSTLLGLGVRPFSGWVWERGSVLLSPAGNPMRAASGLPTLGQGERWASPAAYRLMRLVDWALGEGHCRESAKCPLLWGSRSVW